MHRLWLAGFALMMLSACSAGGNAVATPTAVPAATSYVAPLQTTAPTAQATSVPTPQPEDITSVPEIITVEPAAEITATSQP
jgi:hypothetical protein